MQNATAGAAAALMTLLVQGRVTDTLSCQEMRALIQKTPFPSTHPTLVSWFEEGLATLPGRGAIKTALSKLGVHSGIDDCAYIVRKVDLDGGRTVDLRYVAVGLRARTKEELKEVILGLDKCILLNNKLTTAQGGHPEEGEVASPGAWLESPTTDSESFDQEEPEFEHDVQPPTSPITVAALANGLTNLVFWARNPKQKGKKLAAGSTDAKAWTKILASEVAPSLHADDTRMSADSSRNCRRTGRTHLDRNSRRFAPRKWRRGCRCKSREAGCRAARSTSSTTPCSRACPSGPGIAQAR